MPPIDTQNNGNKGGSRSSPVLDSKNAIGIPIIKTPITTNRYLSMSIRHHKAIYLFDVYINQLSKILDIIGLILIGGTVYSFIGMIESEFRWPVFWSCAAGALVIILLRKRKQKRLDNSRKE